MRTTTALFVGGTAVLAAAFAVVVACGEDLEAPPTVAPSPEASPEAQGPLDDDAGGEPCNGPVDNPAGCRCTILNTKRVCFNGLRGAKGACNQAGLQTCSVGSDGRARWSECADASVPASSERCFNDLDDDCDGKVDFGCACSEFVDMCTPPDGGAMYPKNQYTFVTVPPEPKANVPFNLFVLTHDLDLVPQSHLARPGHCYGGATSKPCPNPGPSCAGWKVAVYEGVTAPAGDISFDIKKPEDPPCPTANVTTKVIRVSP